MAFNPDKYFIEDWLQLEDANLLQKICNIVDTDGLLVGQYKTRLIIVPVGVTIPHGASKGRPKTGQAPALFRSFSYDDDGNQIASLPSIQEWTQACEDAAQGAGPDPDPIDVPFGASLVGVTCLPSAGLTNLVVGSETLLHTYTIPAGEVFYVRRVSGSGENVAEYILYVDSVEVERRFSGWHNWNVDFMYDTANGGKLLEEAQVLELKVINCGDEPADFNSVFIVVRKAV